MEGCDGGATVEDRRWRVKVMRVIEGAIEGEEMGRTDAMRSEERASRATSVR
jgi:hypothetical protein